MMSFISFISSIAVLGIAERFHCDERYCYELLDEKYFTLSTYIKERYSIDSGRRSSYAVVTLIVVSLWFLFFSMICTGSSFMRVLRKHRHHDKPVQPTVTINDADDSKILGPAISYTDYTREISNITAASGGGGGGCEVEEKKG